MTCAEPLLTPARPAPIRAAILAYLSQPRSAGEVADHICRPIPTATGHLNAARKLGLVTRLARSQYALAGFDGDLIPQPRTRARPHDETKLRRTIIDLLHDTRTETDLHVLTNAPPDQIRNEVHRLWRHAFVQGDATTGFRLRDHIRRRLAGSIRNP